MPDLAQPLAPALRFFTRADPNDAWAETTRSFCGDQVDVRMSGLPAGAAVDLSAESGGWRSQSSFHARDDGTLDLAADAPDSGGYSGVDPDGPFWSMTYTGGSMFEDFPVTLHAALDGQPPIDATLDRTWGPDGVTPLTVSDGGLVGVFVAPAGPGPHPGLILFGGSEGGLETGQLLAEYYASLGYACLGLAYFGAPGLPAELAHVPLEYFQTALVWLAQRPEVDPNRIGVIGGSRGGELALLLGATYPQIRAVVALVPSGVVWPATTAKTQAAWTLAGRDVAYIPPSNTPPGVYTDGDGNTVYATAPAILGDLAHATAAERDAATIRVERTRGPILMIGGADDQLWASCALSQVAADRLARTGHARDHGDALVCYPDTGHAIDQPDLPTQGADEAYLPDAGAWFALGGKPAATAHAARDSDTRIRRFLRASLGR
jgi:dienelactone hydrolase